MESALLILLILNFIFTIVVVIIGLLIGSIIVQIMEVLRKLPEELRGQRKREGQPPDRPWYTYL